MAQRGTPEPAEWRLAQLIAGPGDVGKVAGVTAEGFGLVAAAGGGAPGFGAYVHLAKSSSPALPPPDLYTTGDVVHMDEDYYEWVNDPGVGVPAVRINEAGVYSLSIFVKGSGACTYVEIPGTTVFGPPPTYSTVFDGESRFESGSTIIRASLNVVLPSVPAGSFLFPQFVSNTDMGPNFLLMTRLGPLFS